MAFMIRIWVGVLLGLLLTRAVYGQAEDDIAKLEKELSKYYGIEKLTALNKLVSYYSDRDLKKAIRYGRQSTILAESVFSPENVLASEEDRQLKLRSHFMLGDL